MNQVLAQLSEFGPLADLNSPKGRLQQASARLFKEKGYAKTTVRDIAAEVGIQSGSIFHHFKNKEEILLAIMSDTILRVLTDMLAALASTDDVMAKLQHLILHELKAIHGEQFVGFSLLVSEWRALSDTNQQQILKLREYYENLWRDILSQAHQQGKVNVEALYLRGFIRGALIETTNWFNVSGDISLEQLALKLMATFTRRRTNSGYCRDLLIFGRE
ncbi:TetR/AcrR family transcriptional regulator [Thalassomonas viridans]|uniref:TetR/AcrR family transcriptional regulator n=1 Tax=Thalassomonas viridans TaxID=137584 RepID=A0AAE9Z6D6_9GAMM|nr:TetR/AcrR family transcriptional regulator [Thalassomonas viridans]WDE07540.1 TetR/AcrR family transcriptional regulator [Thalassomonas viridans]